MADLRNPDTDYVLALDARTGRRLRRATAEESARFLAQHSRHAWLCRPLREGDIVLDRASTLTAESAPSLQNIPVHSPVGRDIRAAFVAPAGGAFLNADCSQFELRALARALGGESCDGDGR